MSFSAVTIIDGEVYEGLHQSVEAPNTVRNEGLVKPSFKAEIGIESGTMKSLAGCTASAGDLRLSDSGVLNTATNNGIPVRDLDAINDNTVVTFNGIEMNAKSAAQIGLLTKDSNGRYSEGKKIDPLQSYSADSARVGDDEVADTKEESGMSADLYDADREGVLVAVAQRLGGHDNLDRHAISAMGGLVDGDINYSAGQLASLIGIEPGEAANVINNVADSYRDQAVKYISKTHGVDGEAAIQWVSDNVPSTERASMAYQVYLGRTGVLDKMVERFKQAMRRA